MKKVLIVLVIILVVVAASFLIYRHINKPSDADIDKLISTANASGSDMFEGAPANIRETIKSKLTKSEVAQVTGLIQKGEKGLTQSDKETISNIIMKIKP